MSKNVALVLASGGSRGLAHIGAIEALLERGYKITSLAGTSMGALVAGLYAAGGLDSFEEWMRGVDRKKVFSLMDFTLSTRGFVKGNKVIEELKELVKDVMIEDLPIPYAAVATDIRHRKEVVFEEGSLYEAIRASISMPTIFTPHIIGDMLLIDGGVVNPVPIDKVKRTPGDILVVVDLNGPYIKESTEEVVEHPSVFSETIDIIDDYFENLKNKVESFVDSFKSDEQLQSEAEYQEHIQKGGSEPDDMNVVEIMQESSSLMLQVIADKMIEHFPPDVLVRIAKNAYSTLEFYKFEEICALGKKLMNRALDEYEAR